MEVGRLKRNLFDAALFQKVFDDPFQIEEVGIAWLGGKVRRKLLKEAVLMYEANQRQGTHFSLTRSEVAGSGKKLYAQKHTGNARVGHRQTNKRRGGGVTFGPKPRDYRYSINQRARAEALKSALLAKIQDQEVVCVDSFDLHQPKTKTVATFFTKLKFDRGVLLSTKQYDENTFKSARNIPNTTITPVSGLNAYDVLRRPRLVFTREALDALKERFTHESR